MVDNNSATRVDRVFQALSDPTRRALLDRLARGERTVGELAEPFDMSLAAISKHIKVLERAELIVQTREGRTRICRMRPEPLRSAAKVLQRYEKFWAARLDALDGYLRKKRSRS